MAPRMANFFSHAPGFRRLFRSALRLAYERELPRLASSSFGQWPENTESQMWERTGTRPILPGRGP